ncbi:heat-shock protein HtpX [Halococcus sp. IIIV-5B]|nr:heat-shock protein HtpX [Halococcus sp. IIIV-5B]
MVLATVALALVAAAFAGVLFGVFSYLAAFLASGGYFPPSLAEAVGAAAAVVFIAGIVAVEWVFGDTLVLRHVAVRGTTPERFPDLHRIVSRTAQQADLPVPTVSVIETAAPHAFTVGYTQAGATMVVSTGLLDALDENELAAVVAHELAHVKNRDVAVMMALSLPTVIAHTIMGWAERDMRETNQSSNGIVGAFVFPVAWLFWAVGRVLLSLLSRYREVAADRGAVAITGSPATLASALSTLDGTSVGLPSEDVRSSASVAAFSIVPFEPAETDDDPVMLGPDGDRTPHLYNATKPIRAFVARVLRTHPDTDDRIERLRALQRAIR